MIMKKFPISKGEDGAPAPYQFPFRRSKVDCKLEPGNWKIAHGGYSLIELLVVITIFSFLVIISTQTLLLSLRGTRRSEATVKVKENLEYAVAIMERQFHSAGDVNPCPNPDTTRVDYTNQDGIGTFFSCEDLGADGFITSGPARLTSEDVSVTDCELTCGLQDGITPYVQIKITAEDKNPTPGVTRAKATSQTQIQLRQN